MQIKREDKGHKGSFYIEEADERLAEMTFSLAGDHRIIIDHTEVSDVLRGKGAGKQLVTAAVAWARETRKKILPLCPFARSVFEKVPEFQDVWDK